MDAHVYEEQGYEIKDNIVYQDNQSAILLEKNGKKSSGKRTRHLSLTYYFITDQIERKRARVAYCPTDDMIADFFTKPLQGTKFKKFRDAILNVPGAEMLPLPGEIHAHHFVLTSGQECVETHVTSGTRTCAHQNESGAESQIRPRTVKVRTPVGQDWHEAISGRIPRRPPGYLRPSRKQ